MMIIKNPKYLFIFFFFILCSCKNQSNTSIIFENKNLILSAKENKFDIKENAFNIMFEVEFNNENVEIYADQSLLIQKVVTTDHVIGLAEYFAIKNAPTSYLLIRSNQWKIKLFRNQIADYKYIYINKTGRKYIVTLSNKPHFYY